MERMRRHICSLGLALLGVVASAAPALCQSADFDVTEVANGVYAVIAKPGIASNGAFIVNQNDVVVVDTHLRPSWARETIAEIKKVTDKPVRYVINTHWHRDHVQGNQAYVAAFGPGVTIIEQEFAREDQIKNQPIEIVTRAPEEISRLEKLLSSGVDEKGAPLTAESRARLQHGLDLQRDYVAEIPQIQLVPGNLTFDRSLVLHEPGRDICLYYYGYAHTRGDAVVYLPAEKIVLTGDVFESGVPMMRSAYPVEWLGVLESIQKLDWNIVIPGHGGIQRNRETITGFAAYLQDLVTGVKRAAAKGMAADEAVKAVDLGKYSKMPNYEDRNADAIRRTYAEVAGKISN
jgi:glyoxylase-like metal-dependent hydrolase (beta-lactamase superfamily II)